MQRRRERIRAATAQEIKAIARRHMADHGAAELSLRAIARDMGMTAGALYSYYDTRDDLITALIADGYGSLAEALEAARDSRPADDHAGRLLAAGHAYRSWAIAHPQEFRLIFGDPIRGYRAPEGGPTEAAARRAGAVLVELVAAAWPRIRAAVPAGDHHWSDFDAGYSAWVREAFPGLPPAAVALHLRVWGRVHGLVALEVYGHLRPLLADAAKLYRAELLDLVGSLGLAAPADPGR